MKKRMGRAVAVIGMSAAALLGCVSIPPFVAELQERGPLYRPAFGEAEEAIPVTAERRAGNHFLRLELQPGAPTSAEKTTMIFILEDRSGEVAEPVTGALIACTARMSRVPGHIHNLGMHKDHVEISPGRYVMEPIVFGMGGRWDIVVQVQLTDRTEFFAVYPLQVAGR